MSDPSKLVDQIITSIMNVTKDIVDTASPVINIVGEITIRGDCEINNSSINQTATAIVNATVVQSSLESSAASQKLSAATTDESNKLISELKLATDSPNRGKCIEKITKLSTVIKTSIANTCMVKGTVINSVECKDFATADGMFIQQTSFNDYVLDCTQKSESVIDAKNDLISFIKSLSPADTPKAKEEGLSLTYIVLIVLGSLCVLVGLVVFLKWVFSSPVEQSYPSQFNSTQYSSSSHTDNVPLWMTNQGSRSSYDGNLWVPNPTQESRSSYTNDENFMDG